MKKTILKGLTVVSLVAANLAANAQATYLQIPYENAIDHEYGYSAVEYNGHSIVGTEFNDVIKVFKNGQPLFSKHGPASSNFGHSVGMNQEWIAVGARKHDATPNDGNANSAEGAVLLSKSVNGNYQSNFSTTIVAQTPTQGDNFGESIDLDGEWMVIGANQYYYNSGYIEIWQQTSTSWARRHYFKPANLPANAQFGESVAIKGDYIVVGAPGANKIYVYKNTNSVWSLLAEYSPNLSTWGKQQFYYDWNGNVISTFYESKFGWDVDITSGLLIVGDPLAEKAGIFSINGNQLTLTNTLLPPGYPHPTGNFYGQFGHSVAIQYNRALVGAPISVYPSTDYNTGVYKGNIFFYTDGYQYKGKMYIGNPSGIVVKGLGRSVAIDNDNVLGGAEYSDLISPARGSYGAAFRMPFWHVYQNGHLRTAEETEVAEAKAAVLEAAVVSPNPTSGNQVTCYVTEAILNVQAVSSTGIISNLSFVGNTINIEALASGIYQLIIKTENGSISKKLVKQNGN